MKGRLGDITGYKGSWFERSDDWCKAFPYKKGEESQRNEMEKLYTKLEKEAKKAEAGVS